MRDIFDKIPAVVILFIVVSVIRGLSRLFKSGTDADASAPAGENDEERRVREIQERIRRIAAERRGQGQPPPLAPPVVVERRVAPPPLSTPAAPAGETTLQRKLREIQRRMEQPARPAAPRRSEAEVERLQRIAEDRDDLAEKRFLAQRHAQHLAEAQQALAESESGLRTAAQVRLLEDLRDPQSVRRAFVLREVLGTPVGLR